MFVQFFKNQYKIEIPCLTFAKVTNRDRWKWECSYRLALRTQCNNNWCVGPFDINICYKINGQQ